MATPRKKKRRPVTEILPNGCHKTKMVQYTGKFPVEPVRHFIPKHDFSQDIRYAELCAPLNYRDIEFAKRASVGDIGMDASLHAVCPTLSKSSLVTSRSRISAKDGFHDLKDYLKRLCFEHKFTGDIDEDQLLKHLEECIEATDPGPQKFTMCVKLLELRGLIPDRPKKKKAPTLTDPTDPKSPDKWDKALRVIDEVNPPGAGHGG